MNRQDERMPMRRNRLLSLVSLAALAPVAVPAQGAPEQAQTTGGEMAATPQRLVLTDLPRATGTRVTLFDGRTLNAWQGWLGYADPALTYRADPDARPIGAVRGGSDGADFAVRRIDGAPAIWIRGQTWGSLVHRADLRDYHLRLQYRWGDSTWAPRIGQPRNNGLLYHTHGSPGEVFGTWRPSMEFEIMQGSTGMAVVVGGKMRGRTSVTTDPSLIAPHLRFRVGGRRIDMVNNTPTWNVEAATNAERPAGQWNTLDLYVLGDRAIHVVNGVPVAEITDIATIAPDGSRRPLTHGHIQLQSEGAETWFRAITIEPIDALPRIVVRQ